MGEPEQVNDVVLEVKEIRKEFPGVIALDNVNFKLKKRNRSCPAGRKWSR